MGPARERERRYWASEERILVLRVGSRGSQRAGGGEGQQRLGQVAGQIQGPGGSGGAAGGLGEGGGQRGGLRVGGQRQRGTVGQRARLGHRRGGEGAHLVQGEAGLLALEWIGGRCWGSWTWTTYTHNQNVNKQMTQLYCLEMKEKYRC